MLPDTAWQFIVYFASQATGPFLLLLGPIGWALLAAFAIIAGLTGLTLGADLSLPAAIQADVIDIDTLQSGEQRSGLYFSAWSLSTKLSLALGVGIVFPVLQYAGFNPQTANLAPPFALFTLAALYAWLPVVLKMASIALMWNFPVTRQSQEETRRRLATSSQ